MYNQNLLLKLFDSIFISKASIIEIKIAIAEIQREKPIFNEKNRRINAR